LDSEDNFDGRFKQFSNIIQIVLNQPVNAELNKSSAKDLVGMVLQKIIVGFFVHTMNVLVLVIVLECFLGFIESVHNVRRLQNQGAQVKV
jgi:hypothetical protein